jgi:hypothetical protein
VQEFVKGPRVNSSKIINIPYMLDTPKGNKLFIILREILFKHVKVDNVIITTL